MSVTKRQLLTGVLLAGLAMPLSMFADSSTMMCGNQPYATVLKTCLQPGNSADVIPACTAIIQNNCVPTDGSTSPALQLDSIHKALAAAYAMNPGVTPPPAVAGAASGNDKATDNAPIIHHFVQASKDAPKPQTLNQQAPKRQKTNFWF